MPGSRRWFGYVADNGDEFAVELDESTYESVNLAFGAVSAEAKDRIILASATRPVQMRRVNAYRIADDQTIRAKFYVGTQTGLTALYTSGVLTVGGVAWSISSTQAEVRKAVPPTDTEQLDGDIDNNLAA